MEALTLPLRTLLDPVGAIPRAVAQRRWVLPLVLAAGLAAAAGAAVALRLDTARLVIPAMERKGQLAQASEREVLEAVGQARRLALVGGIAKGLLVTPLQVLALALALKLAGWLLGRTARLADLFTVAALAMLPVAVFHGLELAAALRLDVITPRVAEALVPSSVAALVGETSAGLLRVYRALDVVNLWGALVLGLGFAAATRWSPWRGAALGVVLYVLYASAFLVGLPGLLSDGAAGAGS